MKYFVLLLLSSLSMVSASQSGVEIFEKCGICHGDKGQKHSLNITKFIAGMDKDDVIDILKEYRAKKRDSYGLGSMMQGQAVNLSDADIEAVSAHISSLEKIKKEVVIKKENIATDGVDIFKNCAICHGQKGEKRSLNVSKFIAGMKKEDLINTLVAYKNGELNTYGYGSMMKGQSTKLTKKQLEAVAQYVESLEVIKDENNKNETSKITEHELTYNEFMKYFFSKSKNPNETLANAKAAWEQRLADIKAGKEVEKISIEKPVVENVIQKATETKEVIPAVKEKPVVEQEVKKEVKVDPKPEVVEDKTEEESSSFWSIF